MSLGERIYKLRTEKNLSQGDLAELLEVSRQSISKWENNNAVPDLEKIIKMSDIFEVSLDELLKGEQTSHNRERIQVSQVNETANSQRKIIGTVLLCMPLVLVVISFITPLSPLGVFVLSLPFLTCGILCFALKRNIGF